MDEINIEESTGTTIADRPMGEQQLDIYSQLRLINETINSSRVKKEEGEKLNHCRFQMLNKNIQRISMITLTRSNARVTPEQNTVTPTKQKASLSSTPRTIYVLWEEYSNGLNGAAKDFTAEQRGAVKHKYCRRKVFWDCVTCLVNSGLSANVTIDQIYTAYNRRNTVTKILREMSNDRRSGRIPHLIRI